MNNTSAVLEAKAVTRGPKHHFLGYYDKRQWDVTGRYLLSLESDFMDRVTRPGDVARVGMVDLAEGNRWIPLAETRVWCWQQGCMLQWLPGSESEIVFNDWIGDRFVGVVLDVFSGKRRTLPRPIYTVSNDGQLAMSLNFARNAITRPGYGYHGLGEHWTADKTPENDGLFVMDLATGNHELVVSIADVAADTPKELKGGSTHWINHVLFSPDDKRVIFLHRWSKSDGGRYTRMYTVAPDGKELWRAPLTQASHFIWFDNDRILVWGQLPDDPGHYLIVRDQSGAVEVMGDGVLTADGHMTVSPNGQWVLTDTYPDKIAHERALMLYRVADGRLFHIGAFYSLPAITGEIRCDLHPRWDRTGQQVCIDSTHEGTRQVYTVDVSPIVG